MTTLGRYEVVKHLASGGMADVVIARVTGIENFERYVVIKQIRAEQSKDKAYVAMFLDEARLAASLHHANIVQVHDVGQEAGEYFFAMEYIHGEDLRSLLTRLAGKEMVTPIEHVVTIVTSAAAGLHYAHELRGPDRKPLGIVHRDVSPANILVGYDGVVKVADFGIAKAMSRAIETNSGTLKGKVAYMPPEQCIGMPVDRRSDVFALGIVLYELVTVRRLFKAETDFLTMAMITAGEIPAPSTIRPDVPPELEAIILKSLAMDPDHRYQTAEEMRLALEAFASTANLRTSTTLLADFLIKQFGRRPEPWVVDDSEPEIRVDVDFDGPAARPGTTTDPTKALVALARARTTASKLRAQRVEAASMGFDARDGVPTTGSGTPMAFENSAPVQHKRRMWWISLIVLAGLVAFGVVMSSGVLSSQPETRPAAIVVPPLPAPAPTVPTPPPAPPPVPVVAPDPEPAAEQAAEAGSATPAPKPRAHAKPAAKPATKPVVKPGSWNPDSLFPKGKK